MNNDSGQGATRKRRVGQTAAKATSPRPPVDAPQVAESTGPGNLGGQEPFGVSPFCKNVITDLPATVETGFRFAISGTTTCNDDGHRGGPGHITVTIAGPQPQSQLVPVKYDQGNFFDGRWTWSNVIIYAPGEYTVNVEENNGGALPLLVTKWPPSPTVGPNVRVTYDANPANDRSESSLAVDPLSSNHMVGASKKFTDPATYAFTLGAYATFDGGVTWYEAQPLALLPEWAGMSDPVVAFNRHGNAYLAALPFQAGTGSDAVGPTVGIAIYTSQDGVNWSQPDVIHKSAVDDKQAIASDHSATSPYYGAVYAAWDDGSQLAFARRADINQPWHGVGAQAVGFPLASDSFSPEIAVADDGAVYIVWIAGSEIKCVRSTDGGDSFGALPVPVSGLTPLSAPPLLAPDRYLELPGGTFRVATMPTVCTGKGNTVYVAWADYREGASRIYYSQLEDAGATWEWQGPVSGEPLLTGQIASATNLHDFHPQLTRNPQGDIACAFYEFGPLPVANLINVVLGVRFHNLVGFSDRVTVTDHPWDPIIDAPRPHGYPKTTFIGDYFGLAASDHGFFPFWTDTRTGVQEIFVAKVTVT